MLKSAVRIFGYLESWGLFCAGLCLFLIMMLVVTDVAMRYAFNAPLGWAFDLISNYLMVAAFFLALSSTFKKGGHITVDFFSRMMSPGARRFSAALADVLMLPVLAVMAVTSLQTTIRAFVGGDVLTGIVNWPVWISNIFVPVGTGLLLVRVVIHVVELASDEKSDPLGENTEPQDDGV